MNSIYNYNFKNQKVLIRVDFNVPLNNEKKVTDRSRIVAAKTTIKKVLEDGGTPILMSHLGRPKGKDSEFSLSHIVKDVEDVLGVPVKFTRGVIESQTKELVQKSMPKEVLLLENLRFYPEEQKGDENFAKEISNLGDSYINDAFGTAHRAHASTTCLLYTSPSPRDRG